jgi:tRNA threonylcarbamoyladenosine dehydratase
MTGDDSWLSRSTALLGDDAMARLAKAHVLVVGVGGVGSWCAEALARTGVGHLTLVDDDFVAASNVNRQCPATAKTVGRRKVVVMRERLLEIKPGLDVEAVAARYPAGTSGLDLAAFDVVIDAIDSVDCKAQLVCAATEAGVPLLSSMGAARRLDPTKVVVRRFDKVEGDGLARALRQRFKKTGRFPKMNFLCAVSTEPALPLSPAMDGSPAPKGSLMPVTCAFGMALASAALQSLCAPSRP